mmetsp:Transcript_50302/g.58707  ORF Transcript_50302/g.58707 Transcript_50302/m.58707 type:complete len:212 (+) Transcript_50302:827-1462(+)
MRFPSFINFSSMRPESSIYSTRGEFPHGREYLTDLINALNSLRKVSAKLSFSCSNGKASVELYACIIISGPSGKRESGYIQYFSNGVFTKVLVPSSAMFDIFTASNPNIVLTKLSRRYGQAQYVGFPMIDPVGIGTLAKSHPSPSVMAPPKTAISSGFASYFDSIDDSKRFLSIFKTFDIWSGKGSDTTAFPSCVGDNSASKLSVQFLCEY